MKSEKKPSRPIVLTLDAGGTTFAFHALSENEDLLDPVVLPARGDDLQASLDTIVQGFEQLRRELSAPITAISFAFPGPADYLNGVIGDLCNLPAYRGGVPLAPILAGHFGVPVFINNDGNLFALGEAMAGFLPRVNRDLQAAGQNRRYSNLCAVTLGTGFGAGLVCSGRMLIGDTSSAGEIWLLRLLTDARLNAEEGISIRALRRVYAELTGFPADRVPEPKDLAEIADGNKPGDSGAAREAFARLGENLGEALAAALTLFDGAAVIGGGLAGAARHFMPQVMAGLNCSINGHQRLESKVFYLEDKAQAAEFFAPAETMLSLPGREAEVPYLLHKKLPLGLSSLGTSKAVAVGAYHFALQQIGRSAAD